MSNVPISSDFMEFNATTGTWGIRTSYLDSILAVRAAAQQQEGCEPCGHQRRGCNICWSIGGDDQSLNNGEEITIAFSGAPRGTVAPFDLITPQNEVVPIFVVADELGNGQLAVSILNGPGHYVVEPRKSSCPCTFSPARAGFDVVDQCAPTCPTSDFSTGASDGCSGAVSGIFSHGLVSYDECSNAVSITPKFSTTSVPSGTTVVLEVRVKNNNASPVKFGLAPLALPPQLLGTVSITETIINGGAELVRVFTLAVAAVSTETAVTLAIPYGAGTYQCGGTQFSASASQDLINVLPTGSGCDVRIESFSFVPAAVANGGTTALQLVLKNYGTTSTATVTALIPQLPAGFTPSVTVPANWAATLAPGQAASFTLPGTVAHTSGTTQNLIATVPVNSVSWTCSSSGSTVNSTAAPVTATVAVNPDGTGTGGACNGTVTWAKDTATCEVTVQLLGAAVGTEYTAAYSGACAGTLTFTTNSSGDGNFGIEYSTGQIGGQVEVIISLPGLCQYPPLTIQLPTCTTFSGVGEGDGGP